LYAWGAHPGCRRAKNFVACELIWKARQSHWRREAAARDGNLSGITRAFDGRDCRSMVELAARIGIFAHRASGESRRWRISTTAVTERRRHAASSGERAGASPGGDSPGRYRYQRARRNSCTLIAGERRGGGAQSALLPAALRASTLTRDAEHRRYGGT